MALGPETLLLIDKLIKNAKEVGYEQGCNNTSNLAKGNRRLRRTRMEFEDHLMDLL